MKRQYSLYVPQECHRWPRPEMTTTVNENTSPGTFRPDIDGVAEAPPLPFSATSISQTHYHTTIYKGNGCRCNSLRQIGKPFVFIPRSTFHGGTCSNSRSRVFLQRDRRRPPSIPCLRQDFVSRFHVDPLSCCLTAYWARRS